MAIVALWTKMKIYEDNLRQVLAGKQLFENQKYYIDFEESNNEEIIEEIKGSKLTQFIDWQYGNKYTTLTITNFIGNINDLVFDPFCGSGTTGVVCKKLNRKFVGIDNNIEYLNIAKKRLISISNNIK